MSCKTSQYTYAKKSKIATQGKTGRYPKTPVLNDSDVNLLSELELFSDQI